MHAIFKSMIIVLHIDTFSLHLDENPPIFLAYSIVLCPRLVMYGLVATICDINLHKLFSEGCV